jgi:hypothetical protein
MKIESCDRIDDTSYLLKISGCNQRVVLTVDNDSEANQRVAVYKIFEGLSKDGFNSLINNKSKTIKINEQRYSLQKDNSSSILHKITNFIQKDNFKHIVKLKLSPSRGIGKSDVSIDAPPKSPHLPIWQTDSKALAVGERIVSLEKFQAEGSHNDPFTQLATHAFQNYHSNFSQADNKAQDSLIVTSSSLDGSTFSFFLTRAKDYDKTLFLPHEETMSLFYQNLLMKWGREKIANLEYRYGINFDEMMSQGVPLSVSLIYKMNIGLSMVETYDLERNLKDLKMIDKKLSALDPDSDLKKALTNIGGPLVLSDRFLSHLMDQKTSINGQNLTVGDALIWFTNNAYLLAVDDPRQLDIDQFEELMALSQTSLDDDLSKYTGRKFGGFIDSAYTIAGHENFKPWVDDHEFLECCEGLKGNTSWEHFSQQLAFVVCKKHLVHQNVETKYSIGSLVPAPFTNGKQEWYRVTSCVNSGTGNLSYTLEPAAADSTLPFIKLFRSTASDKYALDSQASVRSDLNPLNAPGYEGQILVEPFEKKDLMDRTIPIWVGYLYQAEELLKQNTLDENGQPDNLDQIAFYLEKASDVWREDEAKRVVPLDLKETLQKYDWIVLSSLQSCFRGSETNRKIPLGEALKLFRLIKKYASKTVEKPISLAEQQKDAAFICEMLEKNLTPNNLVLYDALKNGVLKNISFSYGDQVQEELKEIGDKQDLYAKNKAQDVSPEALRSSLEEWHSTLKAIAKERGETVEQKNNRGVVCVGHSLGGASAQRTFAKYTLLQNRMPVPGQKIELYDFDAPGINASDNEAFIKIGNKHSQLLHSYKNPLVIHRRQVGGDFIPLGGTAHLGATFTHKDTRDALNWLEFDAQLFHPTPEATFPGITDTPFTHGVQAIPPSYRNKDNISQVQARVMRFDTGVQGAFNKRSSSLRKHAWKIDSQLTRMIELEKESGLVRTALRTDLFGRSKDIRETSSPLHGPWYEHTTQEGVFVVNENGVLAY